MNFNLPKRTIHYKGGFLMVNRDDDPTYQCTSCFKLFYADDLEINLALKHIECLNCHSALREITEENPKITQ